MKRTVKYVAIMMLCANLAAPMTAHAKNYHVPETDLHIRIDDSIWYVFTRENIKDNEEMESLGLTYDFMYDMMQENKVYLDALLLYEDYEFIELFVRKKGTDEVTNLSDFDTDEVMEFSEEMAKEIGTENYDVYESDYKYAHLEHEDSGYYINQYITVVNEEIYVISFQGTMEFVAEEYEEMEDIVDSIRFDVDPTMKKRTNKKADGSSILMAGLKGGLKGMVIGGVAGAVASFLKKKSKNKVSDKIEPSEDEGSKDD